MSVRHDARHSIGGALLLMLMAQWRNGMYDNAWRLLTPSHL